jgi:exopolyphosphatase/pppGpp-phosphohydrolase
MTDLEPNIRGLYLAASRNVLPGTPVTVLHIGDMQTAVVTGAGAEPGRVLLLAIGSRKTATELFLHNPPAPVEIENAIMQVEDEITRAREMTAAYPSLFTTGMDIREIAAIAGHADAAQQLSVEDVERVFSLLAGNVLGTPSAIAGIPDSHAFAASLLILREFMQHLGFASVNVAN